LGEGAFGEVFKAYYREPGTNARLVAVKTLKTGAAYEDRQEFLDEVHLMKELNGHPNVLGIIGHCLLDEPYLLLVELCMHGNLRDLLRASRASSSNMQFEFEQLRKFSMQICSGMAHLHQQGILHRDLAARNVLVSKGLHCKVADFGMSRQHDEYRTTATRLPIKWMDIQSLADRIYTTKSDVWSFGVTCFEIFSLGGTPYPTYSNGQMLDLLRSGYRMPKPSQANQAIYDIMLLTWQEDPDHRPVRLRQWFS
ncbi:uncharacterized protein MONBRDRAFT_14040, partial [Monosiga brevicollis MX1]